MIYLRNYAFSCSMSASDELEAARSKVQVAEERAHEASLAHAALLEAVGGATAMLSLLSALHGAPDATASTHAHMHARCMRMKAHARMHAHT